MEWSHSGYIKSYGVYQDDVAIGGLTISEEQHQLQTAARLMFNTQPSQSMDFQFHYDLQAVIHSESSFDSNNGVSTLNTSSSAAYRINDVGATLGEQSNLTWLQNIDRFNLQWHFEEADLTLGRQAMSFGSARFINPTDIFLPFQIQTLNQEYRIGIDAIRFQYYQSELVTWDTGLIIGKDAKTENNAAFIRNTFSLSGTQWEWMWIHLDYAHVAGFGFQRSIGDVGVWFETANSQLETNSYWRHSMGVDYAFNEELLGMVEYHYNGAGADDPNQYISTGQINQSNNLGVYQLGRHYLIPSLSWTASALWQVSMSAYGNMDDQSVLFQVSANTSWSDNAYSELGCFVGTGQSAESLLQLGSEYGNTPTTVYASLSYYF
jgi:hypothetical protein